MQIPVNSIEPVFPNSNSSLSALGMSAEKRPRRLADTWNARLYCYRLMLQKTK
jgi:hypothetical protein